MKRFLCIFLILIFTFIFSSCKSENTSSFNDSSVVSLTSSTVETVTQIEEIQSEETAVSSTEQVVSQNTSSVVSSEPDESSTITPTVPAPLPQPTTFTGLPPLSAIEYTITDPLNERGLSTERKGFSFGVAKDGQPHDITVNNQAFFDYCNSNALAWDNKSDEKVLYLTFDCGYPYKDLVPRILNTLNEKEVKSAFFVTMQYLKEAPDEVASMINNGHIVGNHTANHPECPKISRQQLANELLSIDNYLRTKFGYETKYFRYPSGAYSEDNLDLVKSLGYRTAFWSLAHTDWDPNNQPGVDVSFNTVTSRLHSGAVILLHSTSPDNVEILGSFIDYARSQGYIFKSLDEYSFWSF